MIFTKSNCRSGYLHRFGIVGEYPEGVQERCVICHKKIFHRVINGAVNNKQYLAYHARQALPPQHRRFSKEYPNANV